MNIYEELNSDFHIQQLDGNGYIYYVPKKKLVKVKSEIAEKLHKCQENESEISVEIIETTEGEDAIMEKTLLNTDEMEMVTLTEEEKKYWSHWRII